MNFDYNQAGGQYRKQSIETASPVKLVVMLYEGAICFIDRAIENMNYSTYDKVNANIQKAKNIVVELRTSLDFSQAPEFAEKLDSLYDFVFSQLSAGNLDKDVKPLKEARKIFLELLDSWQKIDRSLSNPQNVKQDYSPSSGFSIEG